MYKRQLLATFRNEPPTFVANQRVVTREDYKTSERVYVETGEKEAIDLPKSNVLKYTLEDGSWFCARPSGTEPKMKFYFGVKGQTLAEAKQQLGQLETAVMERVYTLTADKV